jgi:hypothetical protein
MKFLRTNPAIAHECPENMGASEEDGERRRRGFEPRAPRFDGE